MSEWRDPDPSAYRDLVRRALEEDLGDGDITTTAIVPPERRAHAVLVTKATCVVAGLAVATEVFRQVDDAIRVALERRDGDVCGRGDRLGTVDGAAASILVAERTALNFLQRLSGIATLTRRFVDASAGALTVLDTRKTTPTLRAIEKYTRSGAAAATNHRVGLYDGVLIKDNHIRVAGSVAEAVRRVRAHVRMPIEVEAQSQQEVSDALDAGADVIMLDNLTDDEMREAVRRIDRRARVEISGGVTIDRLRTLATLGADCVSVGALTHSAPAADISLEIEL